MSASNLLDLPHLEQQAMLAALRRARYGYLLALHVLLLRAAGKSPTEIAEFLFCSRSSVYRIVQAYQSGSLAFSATEDGHLLPPTRTSVLMPWLRRSLLALLKKPPSAFSWCQTRWTCATLAAQLQIKHGLEVSAETLRRWLHELDWVWKRAKLKARDDDPLRIDKLARIRYTFENLGKKAVLLFADELDINLLAKVGSQWMPKGEQLEIATPGKNEKRYLAGALNLVTGVVTQVVWYSKKAGLFVDLLIAVDAAYPVSQYERIVLVVDNAKIHYSGVVLKWLLTHPRFELLYQPRYCPKANPIERVNGDVHDNCTRNHRRKRIRDLVQDVKRHFEKNGPWKYKLSSIYYEPEVTAAVERLAAAAKKQAAGVYESLVE